MIDISTEAKMLLMDNRTTLFKADFILDADRNNVLDAAGLNLDNHENSYVGHTNATFSNEGIWLYEGFGCNFKDVPMDLLQRYKYMFASVYIKCNEISEETEISPGIYFKNQSGTNSSSYISSTKYNMVSGSDYIRVSGRFEISKMDSFNSNIRNAEQLIGIYCHIYKNGLHIDIDYKDAMIEFNNTGVLGDYVNCFVVNGGSYDDVSALRHLTGDDVMANTVVFSDSVSSSNSFDIGSAIINSLSLTLNNYDDRFSLYDFTGAKIRPYIGIPLETTEWITKGYYTVDKPTSIGNTIPLTMLDNMSKFEKPYSEVAQTFPATISQILQSICIYCGVVLDNTTFTNSTLSIPSRPEDENLSCLDMVSAIAQLAGCYARINNQGYLQMMWYDTEAFNDDSEDYDGGTFLTNTTPYSDGDSVDGGDFSYDGTEDSADGGSFTYGDYFSCYAFSSFSIGTDDIVITGIKVSVDSDNYYAVGEDGYVLELSNNPLITAENMESVAQFLGNKIIGMKFRPFNVSALSDPTVESGDAIRLTDRKGNYYDSFVTNCSYKFGNYESFACNAESVSQRNATNYSPLTKAVEQARKDTQKALSTYDEAVKNMSSLQSNALGFYETFTTELDGSRISYMHDHPVLADSSIIWKKSVSGMFVSTDGGVTWGGMTADLNIVAKVLNVIGINADWINAGTITGRTIIGGTINGTTVSGGTINGTTVSGGTINGTTISGGTINGTTISGGTITGVTINGSTINGGSNVNFTSPNGTEFQFGTAASWLSNLVVTHPSNDIGVDVVRSEGKDSVDMKWWGIKKWSDYAQYSAVFESDSDERLKKDILPFESSIAESLIKNTQFKRFKLKDDAIEREYIGIIAQEFQPIIKNLGLDDRVFVTENHDGYLHIEYHQLICIALSALQDVYAKLESQQHEIDELKRQVKYLMEKVGG